MLRFIDGCIKTRPGLWPSAGTGSAQETSPVLELCPLPRACLDRPGKEDLHLLMRFIFSLANFVFLVVPFSFPLRKDRLIFLIIPVQC